MKYFCALMLLAVLAGCGGGGGGGSVPSVAPPPGNNAGGGSGPTAHPSNSPSPAPTITQSPTTTPTPISTPVQPTPTPTSAASSASVRITADIPVNDANNFQQYPLMVGLRLLSVNGLGANTVWTQRAKCTSNACPFSVSAPVGSDVFAIAYAYGSTGRADANLVPLSYQGGFTVPVSANTTNSAAVSLLAVPAYYELDSQGSTGPFSGRIPLVLNFVDASNSCLPQQVSSNDCTLTSFLRGTFADPITLTDTDGSGQTSLSLNGGGGRSSVTVTNSSDTVTVLVQSGANVQQAYITPSGSLSGAEFGSAYAATTLAPWYTQDVNGLGFTCTEGACNTTGPVSITIQ